MITRLDKMPLDGMRAFSKAAHQISPPQVRLFLVSQQSTPIGSRYSWLIDVDHEHVLVLQNRTAPVPRSRQILRPFPPSQNSSLCQLEVPPLAGLSTLIFWSTMQSIFESLDSVLSKQMNLAALGSRLLFGIDSSTQLGRLSRSTLSPVGPRPIIQGFIAAYFECSCRASLWQK